MIGGYSQDQKGRREWRREKWEGKKCKLQWFGFRRKQWHYMNTAYVQTEMASGSDVTSMFYGEFNICNCSVFCFIFIQKQCRSS